MLEVYIGYTMGVVKVSGFINQKKLCYDMELYHMISSFPKLTLVMVGISNVCQVIEVNTVIIPRVLQLLQLEC